MRETVDTDRVAYGAGRSSGVILRKVPGFARVVETKAAPPVITCAGSALSGAPVPPLAQLMLHLFDQPRAFLFKQFSPLSQQLRRPDPREAVR